jgi:type II secretory pathway pseudopilin PulG
MRKIKKRGQVWIETVIYTLLAFVMIGLVLAYARPKIQQLQDRTLIEQALSMMKDIDNTILTMGSSGNQRLFTLEIKKGDMKIDGANDKIIFEMQSAYLYSEVGTTINDGNIAVKTEKRGSDNWVTLTRSYQSYNITYAGLDQVKTITQASTAYKFVIANRGGSKPNINIEIS